MKPEELVIFFVAIAIIAKKIYDKADFSLASLELPHLTWKFYVTLLVIAFPILIYLNYRFNYALHYKFQERKRKRQEKKQLERDINRALDEKLEHFSLNQAEDFIAELTEYLENISGKKELANVKRLLNDKLEETEHKRKELEHEDAISELNYQKNELKQEIAQLDKQKKEREWKEASDKKVILTKLDTWNNTVFKKEKLKQKEIEVLLDEGYEYTNEYCVNEQRVISVLIKPLSNHSKTHAFLVWSVKQLLVGIDGVFHIQEHLSKDADITFIYGGKKYAIEVETGSLLGKTVQTKEKLDYLNKKYLKRWMFVISNKNLLPDYRKLGLTTQRIGVAENLQKLLENST